MDDPFESIEPVFTLRDYKMERMILSPSHWAAFTCPIALQWKPVPFAPDRTAEIPKNARGVYSFVVQPGIANHPHCSYLLYVGKVEEQGFRARYSQYLGERLKGQNTRRVHVSRMLRKWDGYLWFCYAEINDQSLITQVEDALLAAYLPSHNRTFPSQVRYEHKSALE
jgi:hypothetical protein